ncbi:MULTISPECIES: hypothetical protein [unclassified Leptolyngbya]|uniref:hypothetical protein n=1 Tax=unclassified Leptolyngbya TaxID=2650499 RepID=UPI001688BA8D|nr:MULTISPECIES: hypothetical protein [unclassified Leptolyngbya]MBD1913159.1 hypothetical protein [Leptolyngbya sp. FACHB-8]MBD2158802.1 hypothetical protein [Leptolyngbya sp. FACHB-16]
MNFNCSKKQFIACVIGCWMVTSAIAGCTATKSQPQSQVPSPSPETVDTSAPTPADSPALPKMAGVQEWAEILKGESAQGLAFTEDGRLLYQDKILLTEIPVSYVSNGDITYAQRLIVSDVSPSGRFNIVKACEDATAESGLCWSVFLADRQAGTARKIDIAKYGGLNWVQWTGDERYALFVESMEGVSWFVALDLQTGESKMFEQTAATVDLSSFKWIDHRSFEANLSCQDGATCTEPPFRGNISTLFSQ